MPRRDFNSRIVRGKERQVPEIKIMKEKEINVRQGRRWRGV
jgi:hypothetical protein